MAQNRIGVHALAEASGRPYADAKLALYKIMLNTPDADEVARELALDIRDHCAPDYGLWRTNDPSRP